MKLFFIFLSIFLLIGLIFLTSLFFPSKYFVERNVTINKPLYETFAYMNDVRNWQDWSPWNEKLDSTMYIYYSKNATGHDAKIYFSGKLVGVGRFRISESISNEKLSYDLSINYGELTSNATFYFKQKGNQTQLTWLDSGSVGYNPIKRFMIPSKQTATAAAFEEGLHAIKKAAELN